MHHHDKSQDFLKLKPSIRCRPRNNWLATKATSKNFEKNIVNEICGLACTSAKWAILVT